MRLLDVIFKTNRSASNLKRVKIAGNRSVLSVSLLALLIGAAVVALVQRARRASRERVQFYAWMRKAIFRTRSIRLCPATRLFSKQARFTQRRLCCR